MEEVRIGMKIRLVKDEYWPMMVEIPDNYGGSLALFEIDDELYKEWKEAFKKFHLLNQKVRKIYEDRVGQDVI